MKLLSSFLLILLFTSEIMLFDFTKDTEINNWFITNDNVMGGLSSSTMQLNSEGNGVFSGTVSTDNNGGFAMTRLSTKVNLNKNITKIVLRVKGDGKQYQFRIKSDENQRFWYVQKFKTNNEWQTITLPLKDFYPSFRGYKLNIGNFSATKIEEIAILIGNKRNENFKLTLDFLKLK